MEFMILGGDERMRILEELLRQDGHRACRYAAGVPIPDAESFEGKIAVLPLPAFSGEYLNAPASDKKYGIGEIRRLTEKAAAVLGGMTGEEPWINDYYGREELVLKNAHITAECAVLLVQKELMMPICGQHILIVGFGRIGRELARLLYAMGARVSVSARKPEHKALIENCGYRALHTNRLRGRVPDFDVIINTVPQRVLDSGIIQETKQSCLFVELASAPYGIDKECAEKEKRYVLASGLPGKIMPRGAAEAIRDTIYNMLGEEYEQN